MFHSQVEAQHFSFLILINQSKLVICMKYTSCEVYIKYTFKMSCFSCEASDCVWATEKERSLNYHVPPNFRFCLRPENICCEQSSKRYKCYKPGLKQFYSLWLILGGFYQSEMGQISCKNCSTGTYVSEERHPGKTPTDCHACPYGKSKVSVKHSKFLGIAGGRVRTEPWIR